MWPNPQFPANLVTFKEKLLNGKLHFLCCDAKQKHFWDSRIILINNVYSYILKVVQECSLFLYIIGTTKYVVNRYSWYHFHNNKWDKVFKNGPNKICRRQPLKNLKWFGLQVVSSRYIVGREISRGKCPTISLSVLQHVFIAKLSNKFPSSW